MIISKKKVLIVVGIILAVLLSVALLLPSILHLMGLHPTYKGEKYNLSGKRALIITTSTSTLGENGKATGVYASEMTIPYYAFLDSNIAVDIASIKGGQIPIEPMSVKYPLATPSDKRFLKDADYQSKVKSSIKIDDVDISKYDLIYIAGGWGAAYDLGYSEVLGKKITQANTEGKIFGSVCHGALGFLMAKETNGEPLMKGKTITAVSDKQVKELGITITPQHPETELRKIGANYKSNTAFKDFFADLTVIDGRFVTGQNQNSSSETAQKMMKMLNERTK